MTLPRVIFLSGDKGSGKTSLAKAFHQKVEFSFRCSFAEPLRNAYLATFHMDDLLSSICPFDLTLEKEKLEPTLIPRHDGVLLTRRDWLIAFGLFLRKLHGPDAMGELALREVLSSEHWYQHFIFDDTRFLGDIRPFTREFPKEQLVHVHLTRPGTSSEDDIGDDLWAAFPLLQRIALKVNGPPVKLVDDLLQSLQDPSS